MVKTISAIRIRIYIKGQENHTNPSFSDDYILEGESDEEETDSKKKVNYGYHPIIDFFPMYRWSAAAAAAAAAAKK